MKRTNILLFLLLTTFTSLSLSSCSSDDDKEAPEADPCGLKNETEAFEKAVDAYYENQSVANCQAYKQATVNYLEAARKCTLLDAATRKELEETLIAVTSGLNCNN